MIISHVTVADLDGDLALLPERYDPRRKIATSGISLRRILEIKNKTIDPKTIDPSKACSLIETSAAQNGIIIGEKLVSSTELHSSKRLLDPGDVLISRLRPYLRQVAFIDADVFANRDYVLASTEFYVLRPINPNENLAFLVPWLLSDEIQNQLSLGQEGAHHPRFSPNTLLDLCVPEEIFNMRVKESSKVIDLSGKIRQALRELGTFGLQEPH